MLDSGTKQVILNCKFLKIDHWRQNDDEIKLLYLDINLKYICGMVKFNAAIFNILAMALLSFCSESCEKNSESLCGDFGLRPDQDTANNMLRLECLDPLENRVFHAYEYSEKSAGFRDLYLTEYKLADSIGNKNYRLRIYTHVLPLIDSIYQTTDNNYNPYDDKVYIEFYKENGTAKEEYYKSELPQTENYFLYEKQASGSSFTQFRYLAKSSNPDRYAVVRGKFRLVF
jgi:hypothetical protein